MVDFLVGHEPAEWLYTPARLPVAPSTLLELFAETARRYPDATALETPEATLSYSELERAARDLALRLAELGIGGGDRVGVRVASGTAALYTAILGVLFSGAAYVPVDAEDPPERAQLVFSSAGVEVVVGDGLELSGWSGPSGPCGVAGDPQAHDDAWIIFTSGSSGTPKGVAVSHRAAIAFIRAEQRLWHVWPQDRVLAGLSVGFDASCEEMWLAWANGAALVPAPRQTVRAAAELGSWMAERNITVVSTVPTLAAMWDERDLESVRLLILGGEACPETLGWRLAERREVWNTYGPTEATVVSTATQIRPAQPVTIGWPLTGWLVAVVDEHGAPAPLGEPGELVIAGVGLGRYLDSAVDAERYAPLPALGWARAYRTGDIVRETADGLQFVGRRDEQVKLGGRRLELGEVDGLITAVPGVRGGAAAVQKTAAGNQVLIAYYVGAPDPEDVRGELARRLPNGIAPLVVELDALPTGSSGKVSRRSLPWPPPGAPARHDLAGTAARLGEAWAEQLGPLPIDSDSDFFALGGSSMAAAKLVSRLRERWPGVAVADVYAYRRLGQLAARLDSLSVPVEHAEEVAASDVKRWNAVQVLSFIAVFAMSAPPWLLGLLTIDKLLGTGVGAAVSWGWLIGGWAIFGTVPGRSLVVVAARRLLLAGIRPGRYPRHGWVNCRIWFLERLAEVYRSEALGGTPFAARWARLCGHPVGRGARLGSIPPASSLVRIGAGATVEGDVDLHGWWLEGTELAIGQITIGAGARVGTRALLAPGTVIGEGAEIEPGSVVSGVVPVGERWAGAPARCVGSAGEAWPDAPPERTSSERFWKAMFLCGLGLQAVLPLLAIAPAYLLLLALDSAHHLTSLAATMMVAAPLFATTFLLGYALLVALLVRLVGKLIHPGFHVEASRVGWAAWLSESLMSGARGVLFSLYSSIYTRTWLRLAGIRVGQRAEVSTVVGANRLTSFAERSFVADDVVLTSTRSRSGWLHLSPVEIGAGTFLGNGALIPGSAELGEGCLVGVLTHAPRRTAPGTSWFGVPALELPRVADCTDASRTVSPPRRLILARGTMDLIRILLPPTISTALAGLVFWALQAIGRATSVIGLVVSIPFVLIAAGIIATMFTVAAKWLIIGRYRAGEHPLWSFFVWRDEVLNSLQDQLAGTWLIGAAFGTPVMSLYLRAMGAKVGSDVWVETLTITEFDVVEIGDGCVVNRNACVETHLFHDRLMRIGPTRLGAGCSLGPACAVLPDTVVGERVQIAGRSVVMRGEELPAGTRWQGAPVTAA